MPDVIQPRHSIPIFNGSGKHWDYIGFGRPVGRSLYHFRNGAGWTALFRCVLLDTGILDVYPINFAHADLSPFDCILWYEGRFWGMIGKRKVMLSYQVTP